VTFAYSDPLFCPELGKEIPPSVMDYLDGAHGKDVPKRLHVHVRRVSTSGEREGHPLFSDPETYLQQSFEEKEALLQHFSEHGAYPVRSFLPCRRLGFCCLRTKKGIVVCILAADPWSGLGRGEGKRRRCPSHAPTSGWSRATASCCSASGCSGRSRSGRSQSISVGATMRISAPCASQLTVWGFRCRGGDVLDSQCDGQGASSPPALPPALPFTSSAWPAYHAHSRACTRR